MLKVIETFYPSAASNIILAVSFIHFEQAKMQQSLKAAELKSLQTSLGKQSGTEMFFNVAAWIPLPLTHRKEVAVTIPATLMVIFSA